MKPFQLASGGTLLTQSPKLSPSGLIGNPASQVVGSLPIIRPPSDLVAPKLAIQPIVQSSLPGAIASTAELLVNETFKYEDRMAQIDADEKVLEFRKKANESLIGTVREDGKLQGGYANTTKRGAMDDLKSYQESIDALMGEMVGGLDPSARSKAILRIQTTKEDFINQGIEHYKRETKSYEKDLRDQDQKLLMMDLQADGAKPFLNGRVKEVLSRIPNPDEQNRELEGLVMNTVYGTYNKAHEKASQNTADVYPAMTAYNEAVSLYGKIKDTLPPELQNKVYHFLENKQQEAERLSKATEKERQVGLKRTIQAEAPERFSGAIYDGDYESLKADFHNYKAIHEDPEVGSDKAMTALKESLYATTLAKGGVTYKEKKMFLADETVRLIKTLDLDPNETAKLMQIGQVELPQKIEQMQNSYDQDALNEQALKYSVVKNMKFKPGQVLTEKDMVNHPQPIPPIDMMDENKAKWYKLEDDYANWANKASRGELSGNTPEKAQGLYLVYRDGLIDGSPLTEGQQERMRMWLSEGSITQEQFAQALKLHKNVDTADERKPKFMKTEEYKAVLATVEASESIFAGAPKPTFKQGKKHTMEMEKKLYDWTESAEMGKAKFRNELREANAAAIKAGKPFSPDEYLKSWIMSRVNSGSIVAPPNQFLQLLQTQFMKGTEAPDKWIQEALDPRVKKTPRSAIFTGEQPSIMDEVE